MSGFHSTSATLRRRSIALCATGCVMNTRGRMKTYRSASAHPAHDARDTVDGGLHAVRDALCGIEDAEHHRNATLSGERGEVRRTAAELRDHARDALQHLAQRRTRNFRYQDVAR